VKTLLLWDIDGTLIDSGGAGIRALRAALKSVFNIDGSLDDIEFAGRTDRWIMRRILAKFGLPATEEIFARYFDAYIAALPGELAHPRARVLPGISALLDAAADEGDIVMGLLTGNIRRGAEVKLAHHGLWRYFPFGAFADDSEQRNELGPHALRRAREHAGEGISAERVWVIGDTPLDIACGRAIGAKTLAVATGHFPAGQLAAHQPSALLADFSDNAAFFRIIRQLPSSPRRRPGDPGRRC
jgi:phosphoglycolate phosphatase-like HAD superfamily hydrolase